MTTARKIVAAGCGIVVLLLVAAPAALYFVLDIDDLKAHAAQYVKEQTGRDLKMAGPVSLSFFPWLGAELHGVELAPPAGFGAAPFAAIDEVGVKVKVMPLVSGDVVVDRVMINGVRLRLESRKDGRTTWDGLGGTPTTPASPESGGESSSSSIKTVRIGGVSVSGCDITWSDEAADSQYSLKNLELTTGAFGGSEPTDLSLAFDLGRGLRGERGGQSPTQVTLSARMLLDVERLHAELADVTLKMRESTLTGRVAVSATEKPALRFDLKIDTLDLDQYLPGAGTPASSPAATTAASDDPFAGLRSLEAEGSFSVGRLRAAGVRFGDIAAKVAASGGVASVGPTTASFYGGKYTGTVAIDARGRTAILKLDQRLAGVNVGALVKDLQLYDRFSGTGDVMLRVTARGADQPSITKTLNGQALIALRDGRIEGVDFLKMITQARQAVDKLRGQPQISADQSTADQRRSGDFTSFSRLTASAAIVNGVARNTDLLLESPSLHATGSGTADLGRETMDYVLRASSLQAGNVVIPIAITGPFAAPSYRVQAGAMAKEAAKQELQRQLKKGLSGLFKKK